MSSESLHFSHQLSRSPSARVAIIRPREVKFSKAASGVFLIHPYSVARTRNSSLANLDTGRIDVMMSSALTGRTDGIGARVTLNFGTRKAQNKWNEMV